MTPVANNTNEIYTVVKSITDQTTRWTVLHLVRKDSPPSVFSFEHTTGSSAWKNQKEAEKAAKITATLAGKIYIPRSEEFKIGPFIAVQKNTADQYMAVKTILLEENDGYRVQMTPLMGPSKDGYTHLYKSFPEAASTALLSARDSGLPLECNFFLSKSEGSR